MPDGKEDNKRVNLDEGFIRALARLERKRLRREQEERMVEYEYEDPREDR